MSETPGSRVIPLPPKASALVEAMRDIGYSLESAISDIVDNSIAAGAKTVDIRYGWERDTPWLAIVDDGRGMSQTELTDAMRPGSRSPLLERGVDDLGRFGLGLKTASFSQCRELTVITVQDAPPIAMRWDLDLIAKNDDWTLLELPGDEIRKLPGVDLMSKTGTVVLWRKIDRLELMGTAAAGHAALNDLMGVVRVHLSRVFHRFISGEPGRSKVALRINAAPVQAFDPFNTGNKATQHLPEEVVSVNGGEVRIQPYILPHHSKVSPSEYERMAGPEGYLRNQGFYVYRNRRLIIWGTWFRLAKQEELTKLARIKIDVPNNLDYLWGIDVRKSRAHPPIMVRQRLKQVIDQIRGSAKRPYTHRGVLIAERRTVPVWQRKVFNERIDYSVNLEHPIIEDLLNDLDVPTRARMRSVLDMIAGSFPAAAFFSDYATDPKHVESAAGDVKLLANLAALIFTSNPGLDQTSFRDLLSTTEPFASWPSLLEEVVRSVVSSSNAGGDS